MKPNLIVIDDFYENPYEIRDYALKANYASEKGSTYPGKNGGLDDPIFLEHNQESNKKIEKILGTKLRASTYEQDIHVDHSFSYGAIVYLSKPEDTIDEAGTSFWRHNNLMMESIPKNDEECRLYGYKNYDEMWRTIVYGDAQNRSKWTRYFLCPMKFNRLLIFNSLLWHSHNFNFGSTLENGRLVQLFFFN
jgi:hypothetical protein